MTKREREKLTEQKYKIIELLNEDEQENVYRENLASKGKYYKINNSDGENKWSIYIRVLEITKENGIECLRFQKTCSGGGDGEFRVDHCCYYNASLFEGTITREYFNKMWDLMIREIVALNFRKERI